jgi:metabolite-proton symporter
MSSTETASPEAASREAAPPDAVRSEARRVAFASAIGTAVEWYDFFIYGTAAALVFAPQFFPQVSELAGTLAAFATFAIGFIARPLGGIVMGHYGDRIGRKSMLVWSLMMMGLSTFAIGLLPNYAQIGAWAPGLLIALRFIQGFALGGEWAGAVLMSVEHAPPGRRGLYGSFVALGLPAGIVLSNLVFLIVSATVAPEQFSAWGWRLPFLGSGVLVAVGLWVRLGIGESPLFADMHRRQTARRTPVLDVMRSDLPAVLRAAGSYIGIGALGYIVIVYFVSYATRQLALPLPTVLTLVALASVVFAASIVACGIYSDRVGRRRIMRWGCGGLVLWSMVFFPLIDTGSIPLIVLALFVMMALQGTYIGPQPAVFSELFPTSLRFSGASMSLQLGTIVGGAPAPFIATALFGARGDSSLVTVYAVAVALVTWLCVMGMTETYKRNLSA